MMRQKPREGAYPQEFFPSTSTVALKWGSSGVNILNRHSNLLAIKSLTKEQADQLKAMGKFLRLPDTAGQSIFKIKEGEELSLEEIAAVFEAGDVYFNPQQITSPLYTTVSRACLYIPTSEIYMTFKEESCEAMLGAILEQYQLSLFEEQEAFPGFPKAFILKSTQPSQDLVQIAYDLQQNPIISVAEPDLATVGPQTCMGATASAAYT